MPAIKVFWEQLDPKKQETGGMQGRFRMIRFTSCKPTTPPVPFSPEMKWATNLKDINWQSAAIPEPGTLNGEVSGQAEISTQKPAVGSTVETRRVIKYVNYADDGLNILDEWATQGKIEFEMI